MKPEDDLPPPPDFDAPGMDDVIVDESGNATPRHDFTNTPEFRAAVAKAAAQAAVIMRDQILADLKASGIGAQQGAPSALQDRDYAGALAMAIADLTDQGRTKRIAPEVMKQRLDARDLMHKLIGQAKVDYRDAMRKGEVDRAEAFMPTYQLRNKVYLDEVLIDPIWIAPDHTQRATVIDWPGAPNEAMIPVNDVAKGIHDAFLNSIGNVPKELQVPEETGKELYATPGGLVIHGRAPARRATGMRQSEDHGPVGEGLNIRHRGGAGQYKEINILGTVAKPARQTV